MVDAEQAALNQLEKVAEEGGGTCHFNKEDADTLKTAIPVIRFFLAIGVIGRPFLKLMGWIAAVVTFYLAAREMLRNVFGNILP